MLAQPLPLDSGQSLAGLTVAYDNSAQSWPVLKPLLRDNVLELLKGDKA